jgi:hypothetical protein
MGQSAALASEAAIAGWYDGKEFSCDWTTNRIPLQVDVLKAFRALRCCRNSASMDAGSASPVSTAAIMPNAKDVCGDAVLTWSPMTSGRIFIFDDDAWDFMDDERTPEIRDRCVSKGDFRPISRHNF